MLAYYQFASAAAIGRPTRPVLSPVDEKARQTRIATSGAPARMARRIGPGGRLRWMRRGMGESRERTLIRRYLRGGCRRASTFAAASLMLWTMPVLAADYHLPALDGVDSATVAPLSASRGLQIPAPRRALSLLDLTDLALQNNPQTRVAWAQVKADAAALGVAKAAYWPQIDASVTVEHLQSLSNLGSSGPEQTRYGPAISLSYLLWDFGARAGRRQSAEYTLLGSRLARNQTLQDVILQVEQAYYLVQGLTALVQADRQSLRGAQESLSAAHKRQEQGLATIGDVYQARAARAQAQLVLQRDRGNLAAARGSLASAVGYSADTRLRLLPWNENGASPPTMSVTTLLRHARAARPDLLSAKAQELASLAQVRVVRGQGLPDLSLGADVARTWVAGVPGQSGGSSYSVGATMTIPLFSGFADRYALQQARAEAERAQASTDVVLRQVELQVWQAYQNVQTDAITLKTSDTLLENAKLAERVVRARYERGLDTILNLLTAQATLAGARAQKVQDLENYYSDLGVLGHAAGGLPGAGGSKR